MRPVEGRFRKKTPDEAWELFEQLSENFLHHDSASRVKPPISTSGLPKQGGVYEVGHFADNTDQVALISKKLDQLLAAQNTSPHPSPYYPPEVCSVCPGPTHYLSDCPVAAQSQYELYPQEQVHAMQGMPKPGNDPYSNNYNPGWRNHPNFSWRQQPPNNQFIQSQRPSGPNTYQHNSYRPQQQYQQPPPPPQTNSQLEEILAALKHVQVSNDRLHSSVEASNQVQNSHTQSIARLETQIGQIAATVYKREDGKLPSQPTVNPKGQYMVDQNDQVQAITTLRNGKTVDNRVEVKDPNQIATQSIPSSLKDKTAPKGDSSSPSSSELIPPRAPYVPKAPYPACLKNPTPFGKKGAKIEEMLETFKQVKINLPLLDAIRQVPSYAKFLKDMCTLKRRSRTKMDTTVNLPEQVSSILLHHVTPKLKDPGVPTISCIIGTHTIDRALLDLGASVNLLPFSVYQQIGLGDLQPTTVRLQLADRSVKIPRGMVEDVLVKVEDFCFPVDFIVMDMEPVQDPHRQIPIILGRPFLATAHACINCRTGVMDLSFGNITVKLNVFNAAHKPSYVEDCYSVDIIDGLVEEALPHILSDDPLEACLSHFGVEEFDIEG